jgi:hypothetical protein
MENWPEKLSPLTIIGKKGFNAINFQRYFGMPLNTAMYLI